MASRRMILKSDAESPRWRKLSIRQRYLYWSLTLFSDDDGISPACLIENRISFPNDQYASTELQQDLSDLVVAGFIHLYEDDEDQYIQILHWWDKQFIDLKLYRETIHPKPPEYKLRPDDLKKYRNGSSRTLLDQKRIDEARAEKTKLEETISEKCIARKRVVDPEDDLPFDENGKARY